MDAVDRSSAPVQLLSAWSAVGMRFATLVGALTALLSLLGHVPVWVACYRGALAWGILVALTKAGRRLIPHVFENTVPTESEVQADEA